MNAQPIRLADSAYPAAIRERLGQTAPKAIFAMGDMGILRPVGPAKGEHRVVIITLSVALS